MMTREEYDETDIFLFDEFEDDAVVEQTTGAIEQYFRDKTNRPSEKQMEGHRQIIKVMEAMAFLPHLTPEQRATFNAHYPDFDRYFYASFMSPGSGKTTSVVQTIRVIMSIPKYDPLSFIIFLERLDEIERLVKEIGLPNTDYAVITSDAKLNAMGSPNWDVARVLFTTHAQLRVRSDKGQARFTEMRDFFYNGKPRAVRIYDEACLPFLSLTLDGDQIFALVTQFAKQDRDLSEALRHFGNDLKDKYQDGDIITVPDITQFSFNELQDLFRLCSSDEEKSATEALWGLAGMQCRVMKNPNEGSSTLQYVNHLPEDLAPMLILDASGQMRATYQYWHDSRGNLRRLFSPRKYFHGATFHHWDKGSGRNSQGRGKHGGKQDQIAEAVAKAIINEVPKHEDVLVLMYKPNKYMPDISKKIDERLHERPEYLRSGTVHYVPYGQHKATNLYQHCKYVFVTSILQYPTAQYETFGLGSKGQDFREKLEPNDLHAIRMGEIAHHTYQAVCRGHIRSLIGDNCPEGIHIYFIFWSDPKTGGIPVEFLDDVFPGHKRVPWEPIVTPKANKLMRVLVDHLKEQGDRGNLQLQKQDITGETAISAASLARLLNTDRGILQELMRDRGYGMIVTTREVLLNPLHRGNGPLFD